MMQAGSQNIRTSSAQMTVPMNCIGMGEKLIQSNTVVTPKNQWLYDGEIVFNNDLKPLSVRSVKPACKSVVPNVSADFYDEIDRAVTCGVVFVVCLIDIDSNPKYEYKERIFSLIDFAKKRRIKCINFEFEAVAACGERTPAEILQILPDKTPTIMKQTHSIFSAPETHEVLTVIKPDALILAGQMANCCIRASAYGVKQGTTYYENYGEEYGAVEYGYSAWLKSEHIIGKCRNLKSRGLYVFA